MNTTTIEWAEKTWNPVTGCSPISEGCENCYAKRMAQRLRGRYGYPEDEPFRVTLHRDRLEEPLKLRKPSRIFVCSMGDLFHDDVPGRFINEVWMTMLNAKRHTFIVLTKRPERLLQWTTTAAMAKQWPIEGIWPEHIWLMVTVENQRRADERIPILLQTPAVVRGVSVEPMLGPVDLTAVQLDKYTHMNVLEGCGVTTRPGYMGQSLPNCHCERIDWVICGGETGPGARPMHPDWVRFLRDQCQVAGVPFLFKQWGEYREACAPDDPIWNGQAPKLRHEHGMHFIKLGAKKTGRILDGEIWDEYPEEKA